MVRAIRSWLVVSGIVGRYALSRVGLAKTPTFAGRYPEGIHVFGQVLGWKRNLRVVRHGFETPAHPVVYAANHTRGDDPLIMFAAVHEATGGHEVKIMMRDDFLRGSLLNSPLVDANAFLVCMGGISISRSNVQLAQLKPFLKLLEQGEPFLMYSGRTRSRSGLFFEYRDEVTEPGGVSFFLASVQRRRPDVRVAAAPIARTRNLANGMNAIVFGPLQYLAADADRAAERDFDYQLVEVMASLVEINATHVVAAILYLKAVHGQSEPFEAAMLHEALPRVLARLPDRLIDPRARSEGTKEVDRALRLFERNAYLERHGSLILPRPARILSVPDPGAKYRAAQPLKYTVNQVLHFADFIDAVEAEVLGSP
jgi:hypothetical protein